MVIKNYGREFPAENDYPERFVDYKHCGGGYMFLICNMTSREHMFKWLCFFICGGLPW